MSRELRPYQRECLERLLASYRAGKRRVLVSLPTGTGKTVIFAQFPRFFRMKKRLLVLAHRQELIEQARDKFAAADPELDVTIEQAGVRASPGSKVVVASVPTLGREGSKRLEALDPSEFYLIVVDEAHHAVSQSYRRIFDHFGLMEPNAPRMLVGFTATPKRGDRRGLGEVFEEIAYTRRLEEMIVDGYLCRVLGWRVASAVSLDAVKLRAGDFVESQLAGTVNVEERNALLVASYKKLAAGRRALVFCVDVAHSKAVAEAFEREGVKARAVWGAMPLEERKSTLGSFSRGALEVLTNCNVLTEGYDEPRIDCILMARPTRSQLLYAQMVGRGTRLHPDKDDLLVIDVADNTEKHTLAGLHSLFDLPDTLDLRGGDALAVSNELRSIAEKLPWIDVDRIANPEELRMVATRIDLFRLEPPDELAEHSHFAWCRTPAGGYRLVLPQGRTIDVTANLLDVWQVTLRTREGLQQDLGDDKHLGSAIRRADAHVRRHFRDAVEVVDCYARWRDRPLSEKQRALLTRMNVPVPKGLTRGQASWMIALLSTRR